MRNSTSFRLIGLVLIAFTALGSTAIARKVRVATYNVEHGIGAPGTEKYAAQKAILKRVSPDIVGFQELKTGSSNTWAALAAELGYPYHVWGAKGPFSGNLYVGYWSRFPIKSTHEVQSPPGANEMSRVPLRIEVEVPGAAHPLVLWNMHHKAMFGYRDAFRRAIEALRIRKDAESYVAENPENVEFVVLGDMNDDRVREEQPETYASKPNRLPSTYMLGEDVTFPVPYRDFPLDHYRKTAAGMHDVPAYRQGSTNEISHLYTNYRLDYIFVSDAIWNNPEGHPAGEIYHSEWDKETGGLVKDGEPLPHATSLKASDHYVVFVDINVEDRPTK